MRLPSSFGVLYLFDGCEFSIPREVMSITMEMFTRWYGVICWLVCVTTITEVYLGASVI